MTPDQDYSNQQEVLRELRSDELMLFLSLGLTVTALFTLGYAIWFYLLGEHQFAVVMTAIGASSIAFLVVSQHIGKRLLLPMQLLFGVQLVLLSQLIVFFCPEGETGVIGWLAVVPALVLVCGYRLGGALLVFNIDLFAAQYYGLLPWRADQYSPGMMRGLLFGSGAMGFFLLAVEYYRDRSRSRLVGVSQKFSRIASQDDLSGLPNRREMERLLGSSINRYHFSGEAFSIIVSDIDNFKQRSLISLGLIPRSLLRIKQSMVSIYTLKVGEMGDERRETNLFFRLSSFVSHLSIPRPLGRGCLF